MIKKNNPNSCAFTLSNQLRSDVRYTDIQDFIKMAEEPDIVKILVIGNSGVGKSAVCNKICGIQYVYNSQESESESEEEEECDTASESEQSLIKNDSQNNTMEKDSNTVSPKQNNVYGDLIRIDKTSELTPLFKVANDSSSQVEETSFVLTHYLNDPNLPRVMIIDSPVLFHPNDAKEPENNRNFSLYTDMLAKLSAIKSVSLILFLLSTSNGGRISIEVLNTLKSLNFMMKKGGANLMDNVCFAYSKCDEDSPRPYQSMKKKRKSEYIQLIDYFQKYQIDKPTQNNDLLLFLTAVDTGVGSIGQKNEFINLKDLAVNLKDLKTAGDEMYIKELLNQCNFYFIYF